VGSGWFIPRAEGIRHVVDARTDAAARADARREPPPGTAVRSYREDQSGLRLFAAEQARRAGLSEQRVRDLVIAVGELAGNTLVHTAGPGTFALWAAGGEVICQIQDGGWIKDPLAGTTCPDPAAPGGGRGLWIVRQLCDRVEIRTGPAGTTFRLHMACEPGS
jgi:anti-sigma regulatory factor (Ser/Thr protein kinase)